jgi:hypothetical protein
MASTTSRVQTHIRQRFMVKVLHYYVSRDGHADGRNTDPATTYTGRIGMTERRAQQLKEKTRDLILIAADNIRAGRE